MVTSKKKISQIVTILPIVALVAIGSLYDERLSIGGLNISLIFSLIYICVITYKLLSLKWISNNLESIFLFSFSAILLINFLITFIININQSDIFQSDKVTKFVNYMVITLPVSIFFLYQKKNETLRLFFLYLFIVSLLLFVISSVSLLFFGLNERSTALGGGPITLARWLFYGIFYLLLYLEGNFILRLLLSLSLFIVALSTGSKGPILFFGISIFLYLLVTLNKQKLFINLLALGISTIIVINFVPILEALNLESTTRLLALTNTEELLGQTSSSSRLLRFTGTISMAQDFLFTGVGLGEWGNHILSYANLSDYHLQGKYPHNIFLEILSELGFFALSTFVALLVLAYRKLIKILLNKRNDKYVSFLFVVLTYLLLNAQVSGDLSDSRTLFIFISIALSL
jgi:O-antigen ligase